MEDSRPPTKDLSLAQDLNLVLDGTSLCGSPLLSFSLDEIGRNVSMVFGGSTADRVTKGSHASPKDDLNEKV